MSMRTAYVQQLGKNGEDNDQGEVIFKKNKGLSSFFKLQQ